MRKFIIGLLFFGSIQLIAQTNPMQKLYMHEQEALYQTALGLDLVSDTTYDVKFYYPDVEISLDQPYISGKVTYLVIAEIDGLTQLNLDLDGAFTVDSVTQAASGFSFDNEILTINFSSTYNSGDTIIFAVYYHGVPELAGGQKGLRYENHHTDQLVIASLSTPYLGYTWWPCKDGTLDKADSLYFDITIKDTLVDGIPVIGVSNGILESVVSFDGKKKFSWRHRYPIVPYYVMIAISNYVEFQEEYNNGIDSFPLIYYVFNDDLSSSQEGVMDLPEVFDLFTNLFGPYPFREEKYGMTQLGFYGGIENQTNTIINNMNIGWFEPSVHELAHSWFADMITCETWHHGWLNEGFATYANGLWVEHKNGLQAYNNFMQSMSYYGSGTIYLQNIDNPFGIFIPIIYNKGAWVLHMLRGIMGDEVFFDVLYTYSTSQQFQYQNATTEQFQAICENVSGLDLDYFFSEWIYEEFYPKYRYNYNFDPDNATLGITINQIQGDLGWLPVFTMPIRIKINFNNGTDTLVSVFNNQEEQYFSFQVNHSVNNIEFDPGNLILKNAIYNPDITVGINERILSQIKLYPNPNSGTFYIDLPEEIRNEVSLRIFTLSGQRVYSQTIEEDKSRHHKINPKNIPKGFYLVELSSAGNKWVKKLVVK